MRPGRYSFARVSGGGSRSAKQSSEGVATDRRSSSDRDIVAWGVVVDIVGFTGGEALFTRSRAADSWSFRMVLSSLASKPKRDERMDNICVLATHP